MPGNMGWIIGFGGAVGAFWVWDRELGCLTRKGKGSGWGRG